jgi:hypothetical protein
MGSSFVIGAGLISCHTQRDCLAMNPVWTTVEDAALSEAARQGISPSRLSVRFRRSKNSIQHRLRFLKAEPTPVERLPFTGRSYSKKRARLRGETRL